MKKQTHKQRVLAQHKERLASGFKFKRIHIRTDADMKKLWDTYGMDVYNLGDRGIILVEHQSRLRKDKDGKRKTTKRQLVSD